LNYRQSLSSLGKLAPANWKVQLTLVGDKMEDVKLSKLSFFVDPKTHEDFRIRLHYDGFGSQSYFFKACLFGYLTQNDKFMAYIDSFKEDNQVQSYMKRYKSTKLRKSGQEIKQKLGLSEEDIENIFDILEQEMVEL